MTDELVKRFDGSVGSARQIPPNEVQAQVDEAVSRFADARIRDFVPILAEKEARAQLRLQALAD